MLNLLDAKLQDKKYVGGFINLMMFGDLVYQLKSHKVESESRLRRLIQLEFCCALRDRIDSADNE